MTHPQYQPQHPRRQHIPAPAALHHPYPPVSSYIPRTVARASAAYFLITPKYHRYGGLDKKYLTRISSGYCAVVSGHQTIAPFSSYPVRNEQFFVNRQSDFHPAVIGDKEDRSGSKISLFQGALTMYSKICRHAHCSTRRQGNSHRRVVFEPRERSTKLSRLPKVFSSR